MVAALKPFSAICAGAVLAGCAPATPPAPSVAPPAKPTLAQAPRKLVVAYLPNWRAPSEVSIDYGKLTHLDVAFENPTNGAGDMSFHSADDQIVADAHKNGVKVLISIGGGGASENKALINRYFDLQSDAKRTGFVKKLTDYVTAHNFDGLDVDIEGPSIGPDYGAFIADLSKSLFSQGKLLTAAVSQGYGGAKVPSSVFDQLSFVNVMAYDATGPWNKNKPGPHSSMEFSVQNVQYWIDRGLAKSKIVLGVPFYGHGFGDSFKAGDYSYLEIVNQYPGAEKVDEAGSTIYYNGIPTIVAKAKYVKDEGLAGIMIWSLDQDAPGDKSLLSAIDATLRS